MKSLFLICLGAIVALAIVCLIQKRIEKDEIATKQSDSTEYAVYTAIPVEYPEELVPVYVPLTILGICQSGDTVYVDTTTNILTPVPLRDAETRKPARIYDRVIIHTRLSSNIKLKQP